MQKDCIISIVPSCMDETVTRHDGFVSFPIFGQSRVTVAFVSSPPPVTSRKNTIHGIILGRFSPNLEAVTVQKFPVSSRGTKILVTVQRLVSSIHEGTVDRAELMQDFILICYEV